MSDYERIETAIRYLREHAQAQPTLDEVAAHLHLSPYHFQRLFKLWAGISPKRFLEVITVAHAKELLKSSASVLEVAHEVGLSGAGRLHDHFVSIEAMSPGEYKGGGAGLEIAYGFHGTPYGEVLLATTPRGICHLVFTQDSAVDEVERLQARWLGAQLEHDQEATSVPAEALFQNQLALDKQWKLQIRGTNFQIQVWRALLKIPAGRVVTYQDVANHIGRPKAVRAVANAIGSNSVAGLIPCHRVLRGDGGLGGYRWGVDRKRIMLSQELVHVSAV